MSANNIVFIKQNKDFWEVYYQSCADNEDLGELEGRFKDLKGACKFAEELCREYGVEYGIRFIFRKEEK